MVNYKLNQNVFREYDIRGIVEQDFPKEFIYDLGRSIGTRFLNIGEKIIGVSGDLRETTDFIKPILIKGLLDTGMNVIDLGKLPTPINYYSMYAIDKLNCSVQITGSHNSLDYNGFKISYDKKPFFGKDIISLKENIISNNYRSGAGKVEHFDLINKYKLMLVNKVSLNKRLSIAMDCLNSSGALVAPQIFNDFDIDLIQINCNLSKPCPTASPDPTLDENLDQLALTIKNNNCDFGIAYDGDADRLVVIDEKGGIIRSDILLALFAMHIVSKGDSVVFDVKCSQSVEDVVKTKHGKPIMYKTGHSYIKEKMNELNAIIGGEMSGHLFFADDYFGYDDAIYASLRLLELISNLKKTLSQLIDEIPKYFSSPEIRIECSNDEEKFKISNKLVRYFKEEYNCNCIDGVRIKFQDGWGLVRASNTQPVLVCRFEANNSTSLMKIEKIIMDKIKEYIELS